jgi:pimeloyl-ACP methyl ester carboxylesterase
MDQGRKPLYRLKEHLYLCSAYDRAGNDSEFKNNGITLVVRNDLTAVGTPEERIVFTSVCDSGYGGDTKSYGDRCYTRPIQGEWGGISIYESPAKVSLEYAVISYAWTGVKYHNVYHPELPYKEVSVRHTEIRGSGSHGISVRNTEPVIESNTITGGYAGVHVLTSRSNRVLKLRNNLIFGNKIGLVDDMFVRKPPAEIDARYNWWGDVSGPKYDFPGVEALNKDGKGNLISGVKVRFRPWLNDPSEKAPPEADCIEDCHSNVLFLPGIKASRLYKEGALGTEDKLWLPNYFGSDLEELALDGDGKSVEDVYARDVLDEAVLPGAAGVNLYKTFLGKLSDLKADRTINDYEAFAYDWRQNVEDIVREGTPYPQSAMRSLSADLDALAQSSQSGKVTVIAHSNGGLLAKALMLELEKSGKADKVDKVVFVGTPQMGTPLAALSLLYGYDESLLAGTLISREDARALAENMPGAYGLLPSETYFDRMDEPFILFSSERTHYKAFRDAYGEGIDSFGELAAFLSGSEDGRTKPEKDDIEFENVLGRNFLDRAMETDRRLDAWTPPEGVEAIQIAGWGLDTIGGVEYVEKEKARCYAVNGKVSSCTGIGEYEPVYEPRFTVDGDKVVTAPSALMLPEASNVKRYWVDLWSYDDLFTIQREHKNLFEIDSLNQFLSSIINDSYSTEPLPEFIKTSRPADYEGAKPKLRMSLYSPLDIHLYDSAGRHTGPKKIMVDGQERTVFEENILNSYYYQFGERKYVGFSGGESIRMEMDGYGEGSYTLKLEEVKQAEHGEETVFHTTFNHLPVTSDTTVSLDIPETGLADMAPLEADIDGDGAKDYTVKPVPNGTAILDTIPPATTIAFDGESGQNGWYVGDVTASLSAEDNEGGSGIDMISYSLDGGSTWLAYDEPLTFSQEGRTMLQYFATDAYGNKEEVKTAEIKIDKTAPEARVGFDPSMQSLGLVGVDNLSPNVSVTTDILDGGTRNVAALIDEAGHMLTLAFSHGTDKERRIERMLESIAYDGVRGTPSDTYLQYKWKTQKKDGSYVALKAYVQSGEERVESHYRHEEDMTAILQKPEELGDDEDDDMDGDRPVKEMLPGMVAPYLQTERGSVTIKYE